MTITLTLACGEYDRVRALFDGRVTIPGVQLACLALPSEQSFPRAVSRAEFDVTELSAAAQIVQVARGEAAYVALPIPVSRAFRHGCLYTRDGAGIATPRDLAGRRVGIPEYGMTMGLWLRGILAEDHGVDVNGIAWRTAGTNAPGRKERLALDLPDHMDVRPLPAGATLNAALLAGEIDAMLSPTPPACLGAGCARLFADPRAAAEAWHARSGLFPIMHLVGVRRDVLDRAPWLAESLCAAFGSAKRLAETTWAENLENSSPATMFPFLAEEWAALAGRGLWRYGLAANEAEFAAMGRFARDQHLTRSVVTPAALFPVTG